MFHIKMQILFTFRKTYRSVQSQQVNAYFTPHEKIENQFPEDRGKAQIHESRKK